MNSTTAIDARQYCEVILREAKSRRQQQNLLPSEIVIIDRILKHGDAMAPAYGTLHAALSSHPHALEEFLDLVLNAAAFWNQETMSEARSARRELIETNEQITAVAGELVRLLERRDELHETSGFTSNTHYSVCGVIERASENNPLFGLYLEGPLGRLHSQFDLKYWPSIEMFVNELALDAANAEVSPTDPLTAAATAEKRASKADFLKALFVLIDENKKVNYGHIPNDFKLPDGAWATIANCALDLSPDDLMDSGYVKGLRQRKRGKRRVNAKCA